MGKGGGLKSKARTQRYCHADGFLCEEPPVLTSAGLGPLHCQLVVARSAELHHQPAGSGLQGGKERMSVQGTKL